MELVRGTCKSPKEDVVSSMPEIVMTNIMDRLPIRDAVRTSILSTNWRFKWTLLSQLVFNEEFLEDLVGANGTKKYDWRNVSKLLLHLKGAITKFVLSIPAGRVLDVEDINHWFLFFSGKGIKEVTLLNYHETPLKLPTHLFSCLELKHLTLRNCSFHPPPSFRGFPNLLSLFLNLVRFESYECGELITRCPLLLALRVNNYCIPGRVKVIEMAKLENLKFLSLCPRNLDMWSVTSFIIFQVVASLSKLEELHLNFEHCQLMVEARARQGVPISFPCLKRLQLCSTDIKNCYHLFLK